MNDGPGVVRGLYARLLDVAVKVGLVVLGAIAVVYFTGALPASIPLDEVHEYWGMGLEEFHEATGGEYGEWEWVRRLSRSDYLSYLPIAYLGLITIAAYLRMMPRLLARCDYIRLVVVCLQAVFLCLVAAGVID